MKISCPSCAAKYSIADEKVQNRLAKIRCRKCSTTIVIDGKVDPPNVYAADASMPSHADVPATSDPSASAGAAAAPEPAAGAGGGGEYSVDFGDNDQRTMSLVDLVAAYNAGQVTAETFVWAEGMPDWQPLGEVPEIVDALHAAASGSAPQAAEAPAPAAQPEAQPASAASAAALAAGGAQPFAPQTSSPWEAASGGLRAAAAPGGGRGSTADLFGSFETAGSESDVTTSAPQDAAVPAPAAATGARNESSVLFSLSALTASAPAASPSQVTAPSTSSSSSSSSSSSGGATRDDSGLIDLKALTAASDSPAPAGGMPLAPSPLGIAAPLGGSPFGGTSTDAASAMPMPQQKSKTGMFVFAGLAFAAVVIAAAIIITAGGKEPPPAPTAAAPTQTAPPAPTPTPTPEATVAAKPPATGTAEEDSEKAPDTKKTASTVRRPSGGSTRPKSGGTTSKPTTTKPATKPAAKPKSGGCGCAPGDLQCAMACAAK